MRAFVAADGVAHREQGNGAVDADALRGDFEIVVAVSVIVDVVGFVVVVGVGIVIVWRVAARVGEPGRCVRHRPRVVLRVQGVVHDFLEADVIVVRRVSAGAEKDDS